MMSEQELQEIERALDELGDNFFVEAHKFMHEGPGTPLRGSQVRALISEVRRLHEKISAHDRNCSPECYPIAD